MVYLPSSAPLDLGAYRWHNRLLLIFTPSPQEWSCRQQHSYLGDSHGLLDRDVLVATIYDDSAGQIGDRTISAAESKDLREQFNVDPEVFTAILIGKDGGEKRRFSEPVSAPELFAIIDAMPMRQEEAHRSA